METARRVIGAVFVLSLFLWPASAVAQQDIQALREEVRRMKAESEKQQQRMRALEEKLQRMEAQSAQKAKELEEKVAKQASSWVDRHLRTQAGDSRFVVSGYGFGDYRWRSKNGNQNERINTFGAGFNPIFLYRLNDWIFFEGELELELEGTETEVALEYGQANLFLNDYMTVGAGKYLLPFGEFIERLHPAWIHKLITRPLPYRSTGAGGFLRFSEVGAQLRGVVPLGTPHGTEAEYAVFVGNGPRFNSADRGAHLTNNFEDNNFGKSFGGRIGLRPFPFEWGWGRLKVGASTYNGKWDRDEWLNVWGIDGVYQRDPFELRGEYLGFHREMPAGVKADRRGGWYLQGSYKLSGVPVRFIDRSEVILRYSGLHQPQHPTREFVAKPRQFTLGWDFWLTPSVVWKLEFDRDFPRGERKGSQFLTQLAVGF